MPKKIVRCISCDGYGWFEDGFTAQTEDCDWCDGIGYVYRADDGTDVKIPEADYGHVASILENLERERMREMGYEGEAKRPWEQNIRQGTQGGANPYHDDDDDN